MHLTPDAIPTNEQIRESLADRFYHPYRTQIWIAGAVIAAAILGVLGFREYRRVRADEMWGRYYEATRNFRALPGSESDRGVARKVVEGLEALVHDYPNDSVTPFALQTMCQAHVDLGEYEEALKDLSELQSRFKDFPLNTLPADPDPTTGARSLSQRLEATIKKERDWSQRRNYEHKWPAEDRLALIETNVGSFWIGFYSAPDQAPKHVESFIRHAKAGDYNGTQIYSVVLGPDGNPQTFEAGSKASGLAAKGGVRDPAEHDRDEPEDTIEPEDSRFTLRHPYRMVTAVTMDSGESGARFLVVTRRAGLEKLNGAHTPFAAVMDREKSLEVIDKIGRSPTYGSNSETKDSPGVYRMRDHPFPPIYIRRVTLWTNEKKEADQGDFAERAGTDTKEPWETDLQAAPKPDEFTNKK